MQMKWKIFEKFITLFAGDLFRTICFERIDTLLASVGSNFGGKIYLKKDHKKFDNK
jgi:hypothetical protein